MRLQNEIRRMQIPPALQLELATPDLDSEPDLAKTPQPHLVTELGQTKLREAAVQSLSSMLMSPLPQFTGQLPDALLPDDDEGREIYCRVKTTTGSAHQDRPYVPFHSEVQSTPLLGCNAPSGHPLPCNSEEVGFFANGERETPRSAMANPVTTPVLSAKVKSPPQTSGLSDTLPSPGRSRSQTMPTPTSRPPSCGLSLNPPPCNNARDVYSPASSQSNSRTREPESLTSRLHDLLQDDTGTSTSLPNVSSSHFPSSLTRETPQQDSRSELLRLSTDPGNTHPPTRMNSVFSPKQSEECAGVSPPIVTSYAVPATPSSTHSSAPAPGISRASNAAMAMEKERKEKKEQERERRRTEKRLAESESLGRSNSILSIASTSGISSTGFYVQSGQEYTSHAPQRLTSASTSHKSAPIPIPSRILTWYSLQLACYFSLHIFFCWIRTLCQAEQIPCFVHHSCSSILLCSPHIYVVSSYFHVTSALCMVSTFVCRKQSVKNEQTFLFCKIKHSNRE